jgi:hypothetical protein
MLTAYTEILSCQSTLAVEAAQMNSASRVATFWVIAGLLGANVTLGADTEEVEQTPDFTEQVTLSGEQARASSLAIAELEKQHRHLAGYVITIYQAVDVIAIIFDSPTRLPGDSGSASSGPIGFEVTVSRATMKVVKAHFMG